MDVYPPALTQSVTKLSDGCLSFFDTKHFWTLVHHSQGKHGCNVYV